MPGFPANEKILKMQRVLNNPGVDGNEEKIKAAFGANANRDTIKETVERMRTNDMPIRTADHTVFDKNAKTTFHGGTDQYGSKLEGANGNIFKHAEIGSQFYQLKPDDQAGTLIHEAAHFQSYAGDHIQKGTNHVYLSDQNRVTGDIQNGGCALPSLLLDTS